MTLAAITISNPLLWLGAPVVLVPLLIHLLTRRTRRILMFPTLRFLRAAKANQSRLFRLRHLILLLLRMLALGLLVATFLRPLFHGGTVAPDFNPDQPAATVILLDVSASMNYRDFGGTLFSQAKTTVLGMLENLGSADRANVIQVGLQPRASLDRPASNRFHLRRDVSAATATWERADFDAAIATAVAQLRELNGYRKELQIVSDFQRSNWAAVDFKAVPPDVSLLLIPIQARSPRNVAVEEVTVHPPFPTVHEQIQIVCRIANFGPTQVQVPVRLAVGDGHSEERTVTIQTGVSISETFTFQALQAGVQEGTVELPEDALPADDTRHFTVNVADRLRVLVISDDASRASTAAPFLIQTALAPFRDAQAGMFEVIQRPSSSLNQLGSLLAHALVLVNCDELTVDELDTVLRYLKDGGGVISFLESRGDTVNLRGLAERGGEALALPFVPAQLCPQSLACTFAHANFDDPILRKFRDVEGLGKVVFNRHFETERIQGAGRILARFDDGHAAMATCSVGAGVLLLCNFSPDGRQSDLPRQVLFVPLLHEMIKGVRPLRGRRSPAVVGKPCSATVKGWNDQGAVRFVGPGEQDIQGVFDGHGSDTAVVFTRTSLPGFHRVYVGDRQVATVAVNVDRLESPVESLSRQQLADLASGMKGKFTQARGASQAELSRLRHGRPLWPFMLAGVLLCVAVEQGLWIVWRH